MIRKMNLPQRRLFDDPAALQGWLGEVLDPAERSRLATLLAEALASTGPARAAR